MNLLTLDSAKEHEEEQRTSLVKLVRKWGGLNTDALLDPHCKLFSIPSIEGFIGYRIEMNCAVVFGDPVCALRDQADLTEAFQRFCREKHLNIIYAIVSEQFAKSSVHQNRGVLIQFGNKLILNPHDNPSKRTGSKAVLLRKKVKHSQKDGVEVIEYLNNDPALEREIEQVGNSWLESRHGPQIYIAHLSLFNDREGKRWLYAKRGGQVIGFLILNETRASSGWLLNNLILTPDAPSGTSELLITTALGTLEEEDCSCVIIGPVIATHLLAIAGLGTFSSWFVQVLFKGIKKIFYLEGQRIFWEKFSPQDEPSYLLFDKINIRTIKALMMALNVKFAKK